ncbi:beta strand repeat-containing protein [Prosthecobacter fusiformis]|nr:autotransporter-associated beta strand repeat-containing protein [Prosthecobacter fusiformis]
MSFPSKAAPFYWDADPATSLNQNGSGTWVAGGDAGTANWTSNNGSPQAVWINGEHTANLGSVNGYTNDGTGGTITLGENITAYRIDKSSRAGAYIIDPGAGYTLTLTGATAGFGNNNTSAAAALTINVSVNGGSNGITKFNNGMVILAADNTWSGGTSISTNAASGTSSVLQIGNGGTTGTLGSGDVTFSTLSSDPGTAQTVLAFNRSDSVSLTQNLVSGTSDPNKGILRQAGTGTLIVASENTGFTGLLQVTSGTLQIGNGATEGSMSTATGATVSSGATLRFDRTDTSSFTGAITGAGRLLKAGSGTLILSGTASTYSGGTIIEAGVLQIANDDALPTGTTVSFVGTGTLDLNTYDQTVGTITVADNMTGTIIGTGSTLTTGATNLVIGGATANASATLNMSGLGTFIFDGATNTLAVGGTLVTSAGTSLNSGTLILAQNNFITAATVNVSNVNAGGGNHENSGTLLLGQANTITAGNFNIGGAFKNQGYVRFNTGVTGGTVTLRGTNAESRMDILIGMHDSNSVIVEQSYFDSTAGTLDALVGTLTLGVTSNRGRPGLGRFSMGLGTLDATTIILGQRLSSAGTTSGLGASPTGTLDLNGGLILVRSLIFADKKDTGLLGTVTGIFNFISGTLRAETLEGGGGSAGVSRLLNWTAGSIETYDASTDLTINDVTLNLVGSAERVFNVATGRTITVSGPINNAGTPAPTSAFTKTGAGTLVLSGTGSTHTGSINLQEGILRTTANDVLSDGASIHFTGSTTLDLQNNSDTISTLDVTLGRTATILGTGGSLTLTGGPDWTIGGDAANTNTVLDMSGLGSFTFDSSSADVNFGAQGNVANNIVTVYLAAQNNIITARSFGISNVTASPTTAQNVGTVYLGQTNTLNATTITIGSFKSLTRLEFDAGIVNGSLKIRATNGTSRANIIVGRGQSSSLGTNALVDLSSGSLDALISTLTIGQNANSGSQASSTTASMLMGTGTLDAVNIILGEMSSTSTNPNYNASGTLTLAGEGTIKVETLTFSNRTSSGNGFANGTFNLEAGVLQAETVQRGAAPKGAALFNWNGGSIQNYDSDTNLTITGVNLTLNGSGTRSFAISAGRTATVNSSLVDGSSVGPAAFTKTGAGALHLLAASTYTGRTTIQEGILLAGNSTGSATGDGGIQILANGTLAGTGRLAPQNTAGLVNQGTLKAGTPGGLSAGALTLDLGDTTGGLNSTGTLSFDLFTNAGDNSGIASAADRLIITDALASEINLTGTLHLGLGEGSTLTSESFSEGDRWLLVDWSGLTGGLPGVSFSQINSPDISLPTELKWTYEFDTTGLYAVVTIVPEPGRAFLVSIGLCLGLLRRRRDR